MEELYFKTVKNIEDQSLFKTIDRIIFPVSYKDDFYNSIFFKTNCHAILIFLNGEPIGSLSFEIIDQKIYIFTFGIIQNLRGRGIGSKIWNFWENKFKTDFNCNLIQLHTHISSLNALAFYKKLGFSIINTISEYYEEFSCNTAYFLEKYIF